MSDDTKPSGGMSDFFTREAGEAGIKLDLVTPDGESSGHWIEIISTDSKSYERANAKQMRLLTKAHKNNRLSDEAKREQAAVGANKIVASLVKSWSFDEPCDEENILNLFKNAPQLKELIDETAGKRALFYVANANSLKDSPKPSST